MQKKNKIVSELPDSQLVRLNKYLSDCGICSRREADRLILEGKVLVNGETATTGMKVSFDFDITVNGKKIAREEEFILLALNKPRGIECTADKSNSSNIVDFVGYKKRIYPIGRLDKDSEGLILMTNQGDIVNKIMKASNFHEKEYEVTVNKKIDEDFIKKMSAGVPIEKVEKKNGKEEVIFRAVTRKCKVKKTGERTFTIVLTQGLNRQIRRMCEYFGVRVITLKRVRIMNIELGNLKTGEYRHVTDEELQELMKKLK